jgi:hypothetical protein
MTESVQPTAGVGNPVVLIDAINVKIRDGQVSNRPIYAAVLVTMARDRNTRGCGLSRGDSGRSAVSPRPGANHAKVGSIVNRTAPFPVMSRRSVSVELEAKWLKHVPRIEGMMWQQVTARRRPTALGQNAR